MYRLNLLSLYKVMYRLGSKRGGKNTEIFYSSKSTTTLMKLYLNTNQSTGLKMYSKVKVLCMTCAGRLVAGFLVAGYIYVVLSECAQGSFTFKKVVNLVQVNFSMP